MPLAREIIKSIAVNLRWGFQWIIVVTGLDIFEATTVFLVAVNILDSSGEVDPNNHAASELR